MIGKKKFYAEIILENHGENYLSISHDTLLIILYLLIITSL